MLAVESTQWARQACKQNYRIDLLIFKLNNFLIKHSPLRSIFIIIYYWGVTEYLRFTTR
jgi:hypothetical protein